MLVQGHDPNLLGGMPCFLRKMLLECMCWANQACYITECRLQVDVSYDACLNSLLGIVHAYKANVRISFAVKENCPSGQCLLEIDSEIESLLIGRCQQVWLTCPASLQARKIE